jgi:hypothetical protein
MASQVDSGPNKWQAPPSRVYKINWDVALGGVC